MKKINILLIIAIFTLNATGQNFIQKELDSRYIYDLTPEKFKSTFNIKNDTIQMKSRNLTFFNMSTGHKVSYLPFYVPKGKYFAIITFMRNKNPILEPLDDEIGKPVPAIFDPSGAGKIKTLVKINNAREHHLSIEFNRDYNHFQNGEGVNYEIYCSNPYLEYFGKYYFSYSFFEDNDFQLSKSYYKEIFIGFYLFGTKNELEEFINTMKNGEELKNDSFKKNKAKEVVTYNEDGTVSSKIMYENGFKHGLAKSNISSSGQIGSVGNYFHGRKIGEWKGYHKNGVLKYIGNYNNDIRTGEWKYYDDNGKITGIGKVKNDRKTGEWKYYTNGKFTGSYHYINGKREGKAKIMCNDEDFDCYSTGNYVNNVKSGIWEEYDYGYLSSSGPYENNQKNGKWEIYFLGFGDKDISATGNYLNGKREGEWNVYYGDGILKSIGYYKDGKKIGVWKFYDKEGNLTKSENY